MREEQFYNALAFGNLLLTSCLMARNTELSLPATLAECIGLAAISNVAINSIPLRTKKQLLFIYLDLVIVKQLLNNQMINYI